MVSRLGAVRSWVVARWRRLVVGAVSACVLGVLGLWAAAWLVPLPERLHEADSVVVTWRDGKPAHVFLSPDDKWRVEVTRAEVDPAYVKALVALEDERFWTHWGVDPVAIGRAALSNLRFGRVVSGASTLTMQLARLLESRPRTLRSKVIEAFRAFQLEVRLSKDEILAQYLRLVPFGKNIEGVQTAALSYFGHTADALSPAEICTLLAVPQSPTRRYPHVRHAARLQAARDGIARKLARDGALPVGEGSTAEAIIRQVEATAIPTELFAFPREAPHAAMWLRAKHPKRFTIRSTLDAGMQRTAERLMRERRAEFAQQRVFNGSVVLVDRASGEVRALVGGFDFFDNAHAGQIAGFDTPRSTGSLLKPVILGMAMERGIALPEHLVADIPIERDGYSPENFDGQFSGLVRLDEALVRSLNVPFVMLTDRLGVRPLIERLTRVGFGHIKPDPGFYGLSIAIGGVEATPLEIAALYTGLSQQGRWRTLRLSAHDAAPLTGQALAPGAAQRVGQVLGTRERPDLHYRVRLPDDGFQIRWKTGTSNGHRDAWSAGWGRNLVAVAWLGNLNNDGSPALIGATAASPLMFDLLEALDRRAPVEPEAMSPDLKEVEVCAYSGHPATAACGEHARVRALTASVPTTPCPYHRQVEVDAETGLAVNAACRGARRTTTRTYVRWPSGVERWLSTEERAQRGHPTWAPGCLPPETDEAPVILHPPEEQTILLIAGIPTSRQEVPLQARSPAEGKLNWFLNGKFLGSTLPDRQLWWEPTPGTHALVVMDRSGRATRRTLKVAQR